MRVVQVHGEVWLLYPWLASFTGPKREKTRLAPLFLLCTKALQRGNAAPTSPRLDATQKVQLGSVEEEAAWTLRATLLHAFVWVRGRHTRTCITRMVCLAHPNRICMYSIYVYVCILYLCVCLYVICRWTVVLCAARTAVLRAPTDAPAFAHMPMGLSCPVSPSASTHTSMGLSCYDLSNPTSPSALLTHPCVL